jgi:hypothetical protein
MELPGYFEVIFMNDMVISRSMVAKTDSKPYRSQATRPLVLPGKGIRRFMVSTFNAFDTGSWSYSAKYCYIPGKYQTIGGNIKTFTL